MNMRINSTGCNNQPFTGKGFCRCSYCHSRCDTVHHAWISCFSNSFDFSIFNTNICFYNTCIIQNQSICNDQVQIPICTFSFYRLTHTITNCLSSAKLNLISISRIVFFHFNYNICICKTNFIPCRRAVHHSIFFS